MTETILLTARLNDAAEATLSRYGTLSFLEEMTEDALIHQIANATALIVRGAAPITAGVIDAAPNLKVIARTGTGYDTVDVAHATERGIPVTFTPGAGSRAVAEAAMTFLLALVKRLPQWNDGLKSGNWQARYSQQGGDLDGKTLGIVGFGEIGQALAKMARPFNMSVVAYDPYAQSEVFETCAASRVELEELFAVSDFVSLHCPQTAETANLINADAIARMKKGAYLVNLARGGIVESLGVLYDGLLSGQLAGIGLDVFDPAPPDVTHPIFSMPNCIVSPHAMATTEGAMNRIFAACTRDVTAIFEGRAPENLVNPDVLPKGN